MNAFVAVGVPPAVEPGILPGGVGVWTGVASPNSHPGSRRQDAALYGSQDSCRYGRRRDGRAPQTGLNCFNSEI